MKKLINSPDAVVADALRGVEAAHGDRVRVTFDPYCVIRRDAPVKGKVGLISGDGSGHEPMHGGFVGPGMLDAARPGDVFTCQLPGRSQQGSPGPRRNLHLLPLQDRRRSAGGLTRRNA
jgi:dihydroxyacetone kinase-like protein